MSDIQSKYDQDAINALQARLREYKETSQESWKSISGKLGLGESTVSAFAAGTYKGNSDNVADELSKWFRTEEAQELFGHTLITPPFQMTSTAKYIFGMLTYAKLGNMATLVGQPGVGKTSAIKEFTRLNSNVWSVTCSPSRRSWAGFFQALLNEMNQANSGKHGHLLSERARRFLKTRNSPLLIVDEAQYLGEHVLEEIRFIHDDIGCGVYLCGNHEVTARLDGNRQGPFAQRSSRIGKRGDLAGPMGQDIPIMLDAWGIVEPAEARFLEAIARRPGGGALRQMSKVLEQATIVANAEKSKRTILHLKDAADDLNAGMAA